MSDFLILHQTCGRRLQETQDAVDTILGTDTYGYPSIRHTIQNYVKWGQDMKLQGIKFVPSEINQRSGCYRLLATKAVRASCHSEGGGRDDTDSKRVYKVADLEKAKPENIRQGFGMTSAGTTNTNAF
jgi:hypothetical protein